MTEITVKEIIGVLMVIPGFKEMIYDHIMESGRKGLLEYILDREKPELVLNYLDPSTVVDWCCENCREELTDYMKENATVEVDEFTLSW